MHARQRSLEVAVFRLSKAKRVSESSLSARSRVWDVQMCYCLSSKSGRPVYQTQHLSS